MLRLQKFISQSGVVSRREAERLIVGGDVRVNGVVITTLGTRVEPGKDRVEVSGRRVKAEKPLYRLLLKPRDCLSTLDDKRDEQGRGRPNLKRYVKDIDLPWKVVGPLDFHSEGVLLLTTDGELAERVAKRQVRIAMTYHVKFQGLVGDDDVARLQRGWRGEPGRGQGTIRPDRVQAIATTGKNTWVEIVVGDARPRVLRAAGGAIRKHVLKISRTRFGDLSFEGLKMGGYRELNALEAASLKRSADPRA